MAVPFKFLLQVRVAMTCGIRYEGYKTLKEVKAAYKRLSSGEAGTIYKMY